ncbi:MAG: hypothetical protein GQ564_00385 [Bacteroidales bacterium]|nr:hypothetical protein [Bacteroidales bacterium]
MEESFNYVNIFETKGIEYLMTIAFFAILIPFWLYLKNPKAINEKFTQVIGTLSEKILKIPLGLFYSKNHTWMQLEKSGNAKVGLDDLLMHITGEVNVSNFKQPGEKVRPGDVIAQIEQNGKQLNISSPISGEVQSVNTSINEDPSIINEDPYGKGWILKIKPEKWIAETNTCLVAEDAEEWLKNELTRFKDFVASSMGNLSPEPSMTILQDGGELSDNPLSGMPNEVWKDFQTKFLDQIG